MSRKTCQCGTSASQTRTFLANHFLSLDFGTALKTQTAPNHWNQRFAMNGKFRRHVSSGSAPDPPACEYWVDCHALWAYVAYAHLLHLTATKQYQCQYQIILRTCNVVRWKYTWLKYHVSQFPNLIQSSMHCILCSAARLWPCLFWLAAPWKTAAISGGMPLAKHQSRGFTLINIES